jgi:hypothetical protein
MSTKWLRHVYQHPLVPCAFGIGDPVVSANAAAGNFYSRNGAADIGAERRQPSRAAIAGGFRLLDPGEDAVGQASDADGPGNAAKRLLDIWPERPERPERRCTGQGATGSIHSRQHPVRGFAIWQK